MTISFVTPGVLDIDAVFTFGMSAKNNDNPIGFFGTGLKFACATLLRTGHKIRIFTDGRWHALRTEDKMFRDKEFSLVYLDERPLGFTTELGKQWQGWMAFRELHSNTLDEGGQTISGEYDLRTGQMTVIEVTGNDIDEAFAQRATIFCDSAVLAENAYLKIRAGHSHHIYYRGVRVGNHRKHALFTYDLVAKTTLTEDRTCAYDWETNSYMVNGISQLQDRQLLRNILTTPQPACLEAALDFENVPAPSPEFLEVVRESHQSQFLNASARKLASRMAVFADDAEVTLDHIQQTQMDKAVNFLLALGFAVNRYPIKVVELYGAHGKAANGTIYISPQCFRQGTKYLASTVYEEFLHLSEGVLDETRKMQTMLFDQIMTMGERIVGQPL